jgi:hypothetical protein
MASRVAQATKHKQNVETVEETQSLTLLQNIVRERGPAADTSAGRADGARR